MKLRFRINKWLRKLSKLEFVASTQKYHALMVGLTLFLLLVATASPYVSSWISDNKGMESLQKKALGISYSLINTADDFMSIYHEQQKLETSEGRLTPVNGMLFMQKIIDANHELETLLELLTDEEYSRQLSNENVIDFLNWIETPKDKIEDLLSPFETPIAKCHFLHLTEEILFLVQMMRKEFEIEFDSYIFEKTKHLNGRCIASIVKTFECSSHDLNLNLKLDNGLKKSIVSK